MSYTIDQPEFPVAPTHELLFLGDRKIALRLESLFVEEQFFHPQLNAPISTFTLREDVIRVLTLLQQASPWIVTLLVTADPAFRATIIWELKSHGVPYDELIISTAKPSYTVHNSVSFTSFSQLVDKLSFAKQP